MTIQNYQSDIYKVLFYGVLEINFDEALVERFINEDNVDEVLEWWNMNEDNFDEVLIDQVMEEQARLREEQIDNENMDEIDAELEKIESEDDIFMGVSFK